MPGNFRRALILLGAAVFSVLSLLFCMEERDGLFWQMITYGVYVLAALFLAAGGWVTVRLWREMAPGERLRAAARRTAVTERMYEDTAFRTVVSGHLSMTGNFFFVLTKAAAGWYYSSSWLWALALYNLALCLTKAAVLRMGRGGKGGETKRERLEREWNTYRLCGVLLLVMTSTLQGIIILILEQGKTFSYGGTLIFVIALYDFYSLISSIVYMAKTRKKHSPAVVSIRTVSVASSLVSMLTLQTAMFASFGSGMEREKQQLMNLITGTAVCAILILWGILMVRRSGKERNIIREENT